MQTARREDLAVYGKAPSDIPALKPYWGKPAVRNFREDGGNVGIIRSPVRATALPGEPKMKRWNFLLESSGCKSRLVTVEQTGRKRVLPFTGRPVGVKRTQQGSRP